MLSTLLNHQLGLYHSDDKTIKINFLARKYRVAFAKLNVNDADFISNLLICEGALQELDELGIDVMDMARELLPEFFNVLMAPNYEKLIPHFQKKILHLKFHYLKAEQDRDLAFELLGNQESIEICYFTEEQMLALDNVIAGNDFLLIRMHSKRLDAFTFVANYYLRLALTNPNILENYAAYLCQSASILSGKDIASKLNRFMTQTFYLRNNNDFTSDLFPGWQVCARNNSLYIYTNDIIIPISRLYDILRRNETVFAYWNFINQSVSNPVLSTITQESFNDLAMCIERLINDESTLSTLTYDVVKKIAQHEEGTLSIRAQYALSKREREQAKPIDLPRYSTINPTITAKSKMR